MMIEQNTLDGLFILAGELQSKKIKEHIETYAKNKEISVSVLHKNVRQYILSYERQEKLLKLIVDYKLILKHPIDKEDNREFFWKHTILLENELIDITKNLESLSLPFID